MSTKKNLIGKIFNRLTVLDETKERNKEGQVIWKCQCSCGEIKFVSGSHLRRHYTQSCGCLRRELDDLKKLPLGIAERNAKILLCKKSAKKRGKVYDLSNEEYIEITSSNCIYCNTAPVFYAKTNERSNGAFFGNGIDRLDNSLGYTRDNSVPCCFQCNKAKGSMTVEEFIAWGTKCFVRNTIAERITSYIERIGNV